MPPVSFFLFAFVCLALSCFVCLLFVVWVSGFGNVCLKIGRVRFPGEVGELSPFGGVPYLR